LSHVKAGKITAEKRREGNTLLSICSNAGKMCKKIHPNQFSMMGKKAQQRWRGSKQQKIWCGKGGKVSIRRLHQKRKADPEFDRQFRNMCIENGKKYGPIGGLKAIEINRKNKPYWFRGIPFDSQKEREVAKWFIKNRLIKNVNKTNCHIKLKGGEIDFFLQNKVFIEFHPWDIYGKTIEQYYNERRKLLDSNGYKSYPLIVVGSFNELETINWKNIFKNHYSDDAASRQIADILEHMR
jgi:rRNA maturation protein Nop10